MKTSNSNPLPAVGSRWLRKARSGGGFTREISVMSVEEREHPKTGKRDYYIAIKGDGRTTHVWYLRSFRLGSLFKPKPMRPGSAPPVSEERGSEQIELLTRIAEGIEMLVKVWAPPKNGGI